MKAIAQQKQYEQFGEQLGRNETTARQRAIAQAWLAGFKAFNEPAACPYTGELEKIWEIGRLEAQERSL